MVFKSCKMIPQPYPLAADSPAGSFAFGPKQTDGSVVLSVVFPSQQLIVSGFPCFAGLKMPGAWKWNGDTQFPTLQPMVYRDPQNPESPYQWKGAIADGFMCGLQT